MEGEEEEKSSLRSPLIQISGEDGVSREREGSNGKGVFEEVRKQLWLAGPLIAVSLLQYCLQVISIMFVGHLGELALSGASMATSFATVTGFSLLVSRVLFSFSQNLFLMVLGWMWLVKENVLLFLFLFLLKVRRRIKRVLLVERWKGMMWKGNVKQGQKVKKMAFLHVFKKWLYKMKTRTRSWYLFLSTVVDVGREISEFLWVLSISFFLNPLKSRKGFSRIFFCSFFFLNLLQWHVNLLPIPLVY
jgi:hypothetical protein